MGEIKIGIIDSGIGGMSILKELYKLVPMAQYYYYADDENSPYGSKNRDEVFEHILKASQDLIKKDIDLIVLACNTATAVAINELRDRYKTLFVGVEPFLNVINLMPQLLNDDMKVGVLTTDLMANEERFDLLKKRCDPEEKISHLSSKNLATKIEYWFYAGEEDKEKYLLDITEELENLRAYNLTHLILGCTHYPLIEDHIQKVLQLKTISPCLSVAKRVKDLLESRAREIGKKTDLVNFYSSKSKKWRQLTILDIL